MNEAGGIFNWKKIRIRPPLNTIHKANTRWPKDLNVKKQTLKLLKISIGLGTRIGKD